MTQNRALAFVAPKQAEVVVIPIRRPGVGELLIEAEYSLISAGTERAFFQNPPFAPFHPGYSLVGRVIERGAGVSAFDPGDRVIASAPHQSMAICDARFAVKIDDGLDGQQASFFNIAAMAIHAVRLAGVRLGDPVLLLGQGLIGLVAVQIARMAGAAPILSVDMDRHRLELALQLGADQVFHATEDTDQLGRASAALPGGGPAATVELSGRADTIVKAIELTRRGGTIVPGSLARDGYDVNIFGRAWLEGLKIVGSYFNARPWDLAAVEATSPMQWPISLLSGEAPPDANTSIGDLKLFLRLLALERVSTAPLISELVSAADAAAHFETFVGPDKLGVVIDWSR